MSRQTIPLSWVAALFLFAACGDDGRTPTAPTPPPQASQPPPSSPSPGPISGTDPIAGRYTLALTVGADCTAIPDQARNRAYTATIDSTGEGRYVVTLVDATFLTGPICTLPVGPYAGLGCNQFLGSREGDTVRFTLVNNNDEAHGAHIVEQVPPGTWLEVIGEATGRLEGSSIAATGTASVWYCPTPRSYPYPCFEFAGCRSNDLRLTFTRR